MLHIALDKLARRGAQDLLARQGRLTVEQRQAVLELVAKPIGAARLVKASARPAAAGERLIERPAVEVQIHRGVRRVDRHRAEYAIPIGLGLLEQTRSIDAAIASDERLGLRLARGIAEYHLNGFLLTRRQDDRGLQHAAGIEATAAGPGKFLIGYQRNGRPVLAVTAKKLAPVAGPRALRAAHVEKSGA